MPKAGLTEIICVIDKSGSMSKTAEDAIGGFNEFLKKQRELKSEARFTLTFFDTTYEIIHKSVTLDEVVELSSRNYMPGGMTALFDAIGRTIDEVSKVHSDLGDECPEKVIMVILTDGNENSSKEYKKELVVSKINEYRGKNWEFVFLGANESAFSEGGRIGVRSQMTRGFRAKSSGGMRKMYTCMDSAVSSYRATSKVNLDDNKAKDSSSESKPDTNSEATPGS